MYYYFLLLFSLTLLTETAQTCIILYLYSHITFITRGLVKKKKIEKKIETLVMFLYYQFAKRLLS